MVNYKGKTILITGAAGFVGGRLAERLILEEGAHVRALVRNWTKAVWISRLTSELIQGDVLDRDSVREAVNGCDVVFHCASGPAQNMGGYMKTNVEGTRNILNACKKHGTERIVYLSSVAVHGPNLPPGSDETSSYKIQGRDYSDSKIRTEQLLLEYYQEYHVPIVILRPTFIWGPRSRLFTMQQIYAMKNGTFSFIDKGEGTCNVVYVDNLVDAMLLAGIKDKAVGEAFLITDGLQITWADFFKHYADLLGIKHFSSISSKSYSSRFLCRKVDMLRNLLERLKGNPAPLWRKVVRRSARELLTVLEKRYCSYWDLEKYARKGKININKARKLLGYHPGYGLEEGMKDTLAWVRDQMGEELRLDGQNR
jgi:nucleoside-diphosphate-sugar epimerase